MKKDLIIGLIGTAILVTAMIGVFRFEAAQASSAYDITFTSSSEAGPGEAGRLEEGETAEVTLNLTTRNLTRIEFKLTWTDDVMQSAPDSFELHLTSPDGRNFTAPADEDGDLVIIVEDLAVTPPAVQESGTSREAVEERVIDKYATTGGVGLWTVAIVLVEAGDTAAPAGNLAIQQDNGNEWTLETTLTAYRAEIG